MDVRFSAKHETFREEVRGFLDEHLTDELRTAQQFCPGIFLDYEHNIVWHRILHEQGWIAPAWPKKHGGTGWDLLERYIWATESTLAGAPSLAPMGLGMCGPMLIGHGTEAQQAEYLPRILSGEDYWCQGYSEPGSGSDLAALKLRATRDGDEYVLNGTKIWTTHAHVANRMFLLVRTDDTGKPQHGITFLLLDMASAGISVEPIRFASGTHEVNQVFFDNVRVPVEQRVGAENDGWTVAKYLLEFERGGGGAAGHQAALTRLQQLAQQLFPLVNDDSRSFTAKLTAARVRLEALQSSEFRVMAALSTGQNPGAESSLLKTQGANFSQHLTELAVELMGYQATIHQPDARTVSGADSLLGPRLGASAFARYFNLRASSIAGGTNEVQKNIIAKQVLGL